MNFKKTWKRFFSLSKAHDGFTLVELIVVIAILAILGGVAVPAYSGYVEKANKGADMTLVGDVKQALSLAYYSNSSNVEGIVILSLDGAPDCAGNAALEEALAKAFGEGWQDREDLRLKYDGWGGGFSGSNYYSDTTGLNKLLGTVDNLTNALGAALEYNPDLAGDSFINYANGLGATEANAMADAAVFYVADKTAALSPDTINTTCGAMVNAFNANISSEPLILGTATMNAMNEHTGSSISSAALMYAIATGYANYYTAQNPDAVMDENHPSKILENTVSGFGEEETPESVFTDLSVAFKTMALNGGNDLNTYLSESMHKDAAAYLETLRTVSATKNNIMDSNKDIGLGGNNYFSSDSVKGLLNKYAEGAIIVQVAPDGSVWSSINEE